MPILIAPENCVAITTASGHTFVPEGGVIDTEEAPAAAVAELVSTHRCRVATDADVLTVDLKKVVADPATQQIVRTKAELIAELLKKHPTAVVDKRSSLGALEKQLERLDEDKARREKAEADAKAVAEHNTDGESTDDEAKQPGDEGDDDKKPDESAQGGETGTDPIRGKKARQPLAPPSVQTA